MDNLTESKIQISWNNVILYYLKDKNLVIVDMKVNTVKWASVLWNNNNVYSYILPQVHNKNSLCVGPESIYSIKWIVEFYISENCKLVVNYFWRSC